MPALPSPPAKAEAWPTAERLKAEAEEVAGWAAWLESRPGLGDFNAELPRLEEASRAAGKQAWALARGYAAERGWAFSDEAKVFVPAKAPPAAPAQEAVEPGLVKGLGAKWAAEGWCAEGDLIDHLESALGDGWEHQDAKLVRAACEAFKAVRKPPAPPPAKPRSRARAG